MSDETTVSGTEGAEQSGRKGRSGRKALGALAASPTLDNQGRPIGEVAQLFEQWLTVRRASNRNSSRRTVAGYRDDMARWATLLATEQPAWDRLNVAGLTRERLIAALAAMNTAGLSVAARQRAMAPMRGLCQWLVRNDRPQPASSHRRGLEQIPLFDLPNRRYHLRRGARHAATTISEPGADRLQFPDLWWPDDRRSFVATGTDLDWTYIAGSQASIAETSRLSPIEARS